LVGLDTAQSVAWTKAYLDSGADRSLLVQRLALMAARFGNDPHNRNPAMHAGGLRQEPVPRRERLLLACAHISAGHRKYGTLRRQPPFCKAMGLVELQ